ncbi:DUF2812 domain-containing protein [Gorillibacterium timonense]|uniref:DUF2812 domain-containing protein n=1 Tax=Gorillibacterium timonense TaxID=1689269 RepID=UPI00071D5A0F|nr:DUF2812 domain-containing protein [Gorillibacterium timonense]
MKKEETRYIPSMGLAFAEESEMRKLSQLAAQGWLFESFAFLGFRLRRGEPQMLEYCLDMHSVDKGDLEEYWETFRSAGWKPICSSSGMHIFSAAPGTKPIYSERTTHREKYKRMSRVTGWSALIALLLFAIFVIVVRDPFAIGGNHLRDQLLDGVTFVGAALCLIIGVPSLMMYIAYKWRLGRIK